MDKKSIIIIAGSVLVAGAGVFYYTRRSKNWFDYDNLAYKVNCGDKYEKYIYNLTYNKMRSMGYDLYIATEDIDLLDSKGNKTKFNDGEVEMDYFPIKTILYGRPNLLSKYMEIVPLPNSLRIPGGHFIYPDDAGCPNGCYNLAVYASTNNLDQQKYFAIQKNLTKLSRFNFTDEENAEFINGVGVNKNEGKRNVFKTLYVTESKPPTCTNI